MDVKHPFCTHEFPVTEDELCLDCEIDMTMILGLSERDCQF